MKLTRTVVPLFVLAFALATGASAGAQTKVSSTIQCEKPTVAQQVEVGDRPGHLLAVTQATCNYPKPAEIAGTQTKQETVTFTEEITGNLSRSHGYVVVTMANGDKLFVRIQGKGTLKDGKPEAGEGAWSYTGGTGKLKGIQGKGTFRSKPNPDGGWSVETEGEYEIPAPKAKKS